MATYRVHKNTDYTTINNKFLKRKDLSWKAKGILSYLLSLPDDWELHFNELKKNATDGKTSTRSGLDELKDNGYLVYTKTRNGEGKFVHNYDIYEIPQNTSPNTEKQDMDNRDTDNRDVLLSTNELSTNKQNTTSNNNKDTIVEKENLDDIPYKEIVDYLNEIIGTHYKHTTKKTKKLIRARWNEGFKLEDFKIVIDKKAEEWLGDKEMEKYLRPVTLFSTKFESYLNQISVKNKSKKDNQNEKDERLARIYQEYQEEEEKSGGYDVI